MKRIFSLVLVAVMLFSICSFSAANAAMASSESADKQLSMIYDSLSQLKQEDTPAVTWYYMVTDLDHNGQLELVAASIQNYATSAKIFEVGSDGKSFTECAFAPSNEESFPDILRETADTYYDPASDTWFYLFSDGSAAGFANYVDHKCSISLKNQLISHACYAAATTEIINGYVATTYTDNFGNIITPAEFDAAGKNNFIGYESSSTNFDWFTMADVTSVSRLTDSYSIFTGAKHPVKIVNPTNATPATPYPVYTYAPQVTTAPVSGYTTVTKSPTSEYRNEGDTAWFISYADNYNSLVWTFVSPYGIEYSYQNFASMFPYSYVNGANSTNLSISNVTLNMSGWGAYCTFYGNNRSARSNTAYLYVTVKPTPTPTPTPVPSQRSISGTVVDHLMSTVTIQLSSGYSVQLLKDICYVSGGSLDIGCPCTCYYTGDMATADSIYSCVIQGAPDPYPDFDDMVNPFADSDFADMTNPMSVTIN